MRKILLVLLPIAFISLAFYVKRTSQNVSLVTCNASDFSGEVRGDSVAIFENANISVPDIALYDENQPVLGASTNNRWVEVDLSEQKLKAWDGDSLFLETSVSTGLPWTPTPTGEFTVWIKLRATKMEGGVGRYYYYLPNVPYVMFFQNDAVPSWKGYGLHGTYWHNSFGTQRSHGCVNLPTDIAKELFYFLGPELPPGKNTVKASADNPGGKIVIHE